ncbi:flagellar hook-length control protein FliK [Methylobacter sp.]|uniref:flagellar hook-length control protein FliK n=1 Tax=Methylobacter sp. TaxID=2051955 RepID=UPI00248729EF|nr:flagellar hook-length control protein FliK [Methylobacter sp.]MDI1276509.1 flagellar hook-length control protein FliK [Methylobacter sp.]MDI1358436.1 flagellar hook-length control protein FliK [Methylobacter sp.]
MNIESANLSPLAPSSSGTVESVSPPSIDGGVISEGFSGALMAQVELLSNIKAGDSLPLQTPDVAGLQGVVVTGLPATATKVDAQDVAALLGNDLPPSYKTKDDGDHEAALAAVTDTLKYITMGTTAGEKAAAVEQNMKDVIAMAAPAEQGMGNVVASAVPAEQNMKNVVVAAVPVEQNVTDVVAEPGQSVKDVAMDVPVQMVLEQRDDKPDKKQDEGGAQIAVVENNSEAEGVLAVAIILPPVMQAEQAKTANNLTPADAIKEGGLPSFTNPLAGDAKSNQSAKAPENVLQSETVFRQPVQDKQGFNLNYVENSGQAEKTGRVDQQVLSVEGEKAVPRGGADITQLNRPVVDNKTDVSAMTKPLSHPEWNKDLGERIVWMNSRAIPSAEIRLNPPHLGPISVRVDVSDDQATVVFTAQHAAVRETLEASIPKLREMMSAQHLNLAEVNISQGSASDQGRSQSQSFAQTAEGRGQGAPAVAVDEIDDVEQEIASGQAVVSKGLLSIYA